jgi:S-disulfanyl-L-cysteine oxidoreductase SoxD
MKRGRTVGSYWPYAPILFDYIRRAMPQNALQSLDSDDVYAVSAYDPRPDVKSPACMAGC